MRKLKYYAIYYKKGRVPDEYTGYSNDEGYWSMARQFRDKWYALDWNTRVWARMYKPMECYDYSCWMPIDPDQVDYINLLLSYE